MSHLRILHITDRYPEIHDRVGGAEIITYRLVQLFEREGWVQGVLVTKPDHADMSFPGVKLFSAETLENLLPEEGWINAFKGQLFPFDPIAAEYTKQVLFQFHPDIVILHNVRKFSLYTVQICKDFGTRILAMVYDYSHFCPTEFFTDQYGNFCRNPGRACANCHGEQAKSLRTWSARLISKRQQLFAPLLDKVDTFITLSAASKQLLTDIGIASDRIKKIEQPFLKKPKLLLGDPNHILYIGWGQPRKGLLIVADALKRVRKPFRFEAIGEPVDANYMAKVRASLEGAGLDPLTCLKGRVNQIQLDAALKKAGIVVIAEQWENMSPAVLHEAMAAGKTVVAGRIGGIPEFVSDGHDGFLAIYNDPADFAQKIEKVLGDAVTQRQIGEQAFSRAGQNTDPSRTLSKFRSLFDHTVELSADRGMKAWLDGCPCVIICGGNGSRLGLAKSADLKSLVPVKGEPIVGYIMRFWGSFVNRFILVTDHGATALKKYVDTLPYDTEVVLEQNGGQGIAGALLEVQDRLKGRFLMVLGDCLYSGYADLPSAMDRGVGVLPGTSQELIRENFSVEVTDGQILRVVEKPQKFPNDLCGMGIYFLDGAVWKAIETTRQNKFRRVHITAVMQTLAEQYGLFPVNFTGKYVNVNYPEDLVLAEKLWE